MQHDLVLSWEDVVLRPLRPEDDAAPLRALVDRESWSGMSSPLPETDEEMDRHLRSLTEGAAALAFAVELDGRFVGRTTLYDLVPGLRVEIGSTVYARDVWGTRVNPAAKLLLLEHAVERLGVGRVALRCDHRNARSRAAIERLGARFEGTLRAFRRAADGSIADIDYFSVLASEWPEVRAGLLERLSS
ncbi:GNAT family N-acetyltransferase [Brachybacterium sp. DNPG3]